MKRSDQKPTVLEIERAENTPGTLREDVNWLREALGNTVLVDTANKVAAQLAKAGIPHLIVGGLAVQEHGYVRATVDVDVVVPDVDAAVDWLAANGFKESPGPDGFRFSEVTVVMRDRANNVKVDILPGGGKVDEKAAVLSPVPKHVSDRPQFIDAAGLITQKIGAYLNTRLSGSRIKQMSWS